MQSALTEEKQIDETREQQLPSGHWADYYRMEAEFNAQ